MQGKRRLNFYDCVKFVCTLSGIFGLYTYKIHVDRNNRVERASVGIFNVISFVGYIATSLVLSYVVQHSSRSTAYADSTVVLLSDRFFWIFGLLMSVSSITLGMWNRHRFVKILQDLQTFDESVRFFCYLILKFSFMRLFSSALFSDRIIWSFDGLRSYETPYFLEW